MDSVNNNQFEVVPSAKFKRKIIPPSSTAYFNPALDILANEDPICNNAMEILPNKKRKRTKSCEIVAFENTALDLGISKAAVNDFLAKEIDNVKRNVKFCSQNTIINTPIDEMTESIDFTISSPNINLNDMSAGTADITEPIYVNLPSETLKCPLSDTKEHGLPNPNLTPKVDVELNNIVVNRTDFTEISEISNIDNQPNDSVNMETTSTINVCPNMPINVFVNEKTNLSLSFIDRLALDSPQNSNQSLYLDDDWNESNIMEIKSIKTTSRNIEPKKKNTNPFLDDSVTYDEPEGVYSGENPFLTKETNVPEMEYNAEIASACSSNRNTNNIMPKRLFTDTNTTISTVNESNTNESDHEYENVYRSESPIYENIDGEMYVNKQSKILGCDVTRFSAIDIMNLNKTSQYNVSSDSNESKRDFKHSLKRASTRLSKRVFKTIKRTFKTDKPEQNSTLNPYEVPRKTEKKNTVDKKEAGIENPALKIDVSDDTDDDDEDHQYETIKTLRNTRLNMNVTPLKERTGNDLSQSKSNTPGKKVRFDSTLNREKLITGDSFEAGSAALSPGFDAKLEKYHDELENCINERKIIQQNM